jgi:hypothetical protein
MSAKDRNAIVEEIEAHIRTQGGASGDWYVGVTSDIEQGLFSDHNVPSQDSWYICRQAFTPADAKTIEADLLRLGCDGKAKGRDNSGVFVYAYLKTTVTKQ